MNAVTIASTEAEREAIYRFRYKIYVEEMGKRLAGADHERKLVTDALDTNATLFYVESDGQIIATLRRNQLDKTASLSHLASAFALDQFLERFPKAALSVDARLMVAPHWRNTTVTPSLLMFAYKQARERGIQFVFSHCTPALLPFYERLGFRRYKRNIIDDDSGFQVPMVLVIEDADHLKKVGSPFYRVVRNSPRNCSQDVAWFNSTFPEHASFINTQATSTNVLWESVADRLQEEPTDGIPLLSGISQEDSATLSELFCIHTAEEGETILRDGDRSGAIFVILSGMVEVVARLGTSDYPILALGPGQVFGETAITRSVSRERVRALSDVTVICISEVEVRRMLKTNPAVASTVLINLIRVLSEKNRLISESWVQLRAAMSGTSLFGDGQGQAG